MEQNVQFVPLFMSSNAVDNFSFAVVSNAFAIKIIPKQSKLSEGTQSPKIDFLS